MPPSAFDFEVLDAVADDGRCGGVGAVRRVRNENLAAGIALRLVPCAREQDAGEFAMRAGSRLQRDRVHAGDIEQAALQQIEDFKDALRERFRAVGMRFGQALDARDEFVDARVVFHGAGAERIHAEIDGIVPGGKAREVADNFDLGELGELRSLIAPCGAQKECGIYCRDVERREFVGALAGRRFLEEQGLVLRLVRADLAEGVGAGIVGICRHWLYPSQFNC